MQLRSSPCDYCSSYSADSPENGGSDKQVINQRCMGGADREPRNGPGLSKSRTRHQRTRALKGNREEGDGVSKNG